MKRKILKNKPLVEAIFELRWELQEQERKVKTDRYFKILIGSLYEKIKGDYKFYEELPTAHIPEEIAAYVVQYRFRKDKDRWPLVQLGPGIITLNDTEGYVWEDFERRIKHLLDALFKAYPDANNNLNVNGLLLRYIDAIDFDYDSTDMFNFLREKLKVTIDVPNDFFQETGVRRLPIGFDLRMAFPTTYPKGAVNLRFVRGKRKNVDALIWETQVQSMYSDVAKGKEEIVEWLNRAHSLTDDWFFKMIDGELLRRFE